VRVVAVRAIGGVPYVDLGLHKANVAEACVHYVYNLLYLSSTIIFSTT
jgi:hypothetical protein